MSRRSEVQQFLVNTPGRDKLDYPTVVLSSTQAAARVATPEGLNYIVTGTTPAVSGIKTSVAGNGPSCTVTITLSNFLIDAIAAAADEAVGALMYTLPAGEIIIRGTHLNIALSDTADLIDADTPDLGVGTTIATGAVAILSGTAAFENIITGQTMDDVDGTAEVITLHKDTALVIATADDHTLYLNMADGWAGADAGVYATGTIIIEYIHMA